MSNLSALFSEASNGVLERVYSPASEIDYNGQEVAANARLFAAAFNAFDSAAQKLGLNAVALAERMQNGELAEVFKSWCME